MALPARDWEVLTTARLARLSSADATAIRQLMLNDDSTKALAHVGGVFRAASREASLSHVEKLFARLEDLSKVLSAVAKESLHIRSLLWASLQLLLHSILPFFDYFDQLIQMLDQITHTLPRFELYNSMQATPGMVRAIQDIYDDHVDFFTTTGLFLKHRSTKLSVRLRWSQSVRSPYNSCIKRLEYHKATFLTQVHQAEAFLVNLQPRPNPIQYQPRLINRATPVSTVPYPQNPAFTGRDGMLTKIHLNLARVDGMSGPRSVTLHGTGGIGKTQIALEYTFKFKTQYSAVFWVAAESELTMTTSFCDMARKLGVGPGQGNTRAEVEAAKSWLESNADWLLVFDNADDVDVVRKVWPQGLAGSIIITTQNLGFVSFTNNEELVEKLDDVEAATWVMKELKRGTSEQPAAEKLCAELGGMPLAISHITGYAARANLDISEVLGILREKRKIQSDIWTAKHPSVFYTKSLEDVWSLALKDLPPAALDLLYVLAFFNADAVHESILTSAENVLNLGSTVDERTMNLRKLVYSLRERHLIERDFIKGEYTLRMHRTFRHHLLQRLDDDLPRQQVAFDQAFRALRAVFPRITFVSRTENSWPAVQKYLPQVLSFQACYHESDPRPAASVEVADLFQDAGSFLWEQNVFKDSFPLLYSAEGICKQIMSADDPSPVYAQILQTIATIEDLLGCKQREAAVDRMVKVQKMRLDHYNTIPVDQRTQTDEINLCRSWADTAGPLIGLDRVAEAAVLYERASTKYHEIATEETLTYRFAHLNYDMTALRIGQGRISEAVVCAENCYRLGCKALGLDSAWTLNFQFMQACAALTAGQISQSLVLHEAVLKARLRTLKETSADTLLSYYMVGTVKYYQHDYEGAEKSLREALKHRVRADWYPTEVARTAFRLCMVLQAQQRFQAAVELERDNELFPITAIPVAVMNGTAISMDDRMAAYDREVAVWHGRSEGLWKPRITT